MPLAHKKILLSLQGIIMHVYMCTGMEQVALTCGGEKAQVQSVLLLTDGLANNWITTKDGIIAEMKKMQDQGLGAVAVPTSHGGNYMQQMPVKKQKQKGFFSIPSAFHRATPTPQGNAQLQQQACSNASPPPPPPQAMSNVIIVQQQQVQLPPAPPQVSVRFATE